MRDHEVEDPHGGAPDDGQAAGYRILFEESPVAIWEEDFSVSRRLIETASGAERSDLPAWLADHPDLLLQAAAEIRILDANPAAVDLFRSGDRATFIANYHRIFAEETAPKFIDFITKVLGGIPSDRSIATAAQTLDGEPLSLDLSWAVAPGCEHDSSRLWFYAVDMTERVAAERRARFHRERFEQLFDSMLDGFAVHEMIFDDRGEPVDYRFLRVNPAFERFTGLAADDIVGRRVREVLPSLEPEWIERYGEVTRSGRPIQFTSYSRELDRHFEVRAFRPEPGRFACHFMDVTDRIRSEELEDRLRQEEKFALVGRVAGGIAHDFNNLLGVILGTADLLLIGADDPAVRADAERIVTTAERGRELTRSLLLFSRSPEPKLASFDLNQHILAVVETGTASGPQAPVVTELDPGVGAVVADAGMLENALANLIQNAVHAVQRTSEPRVTVRSGRGEDRFVIEVEDNGCGIPLDRQEQVFEPTFSLKGGRDADGSYPPEVAGSGYGLANVRRCMDCHRGTVSFTSRPGGGSTFRLEVPLLDHAEPPGKDSRSTPVPAGLRGRLLVVEDEADYAEILARAARRDGHRVDIAGSRAEALDLLDVGDYDLISLDYLLPDGNGLDIYRAQREGGGRLPVLFVSGNLAFMQSMTELEDRDPLVAHLVKPFTTGEYLVRVQALLGHAREARGPRA